MFLLNGLKLYLSQKSDSLGTFLSRLCSNNCDIFRTSNGYSNESLESLNLSEDPESDREMDIEEADEIEVINEVDGEHQGDVGDVDVVGDVE